MCKPPISAAEPSLRSEEQVDQEQSRETGEGAKQERQFRGKRPAAQKLQVPARQPGSRLEILMQIDLELRHCNAPASMAEVMHQIFEFAVELTLGNLEKCPPPAGPQLPSLLRI
jgi:hypothetical protein